MEIRSFYIALDGSAAYIGLCSRERHLGFVVYGKEDGRRVLSQQAANDPNASVILRDINVSSMPERAAGRMHILEGGAAGEFNEAAQYMAHATRQGAIMLGEMTGVSRNGPHLAISQSSGMRAGILAFCAPDSQHHVFVFHSKAQARDFLNTHLLWLSRGTYRDVLRFVDRDHLRESMPGDGLKGASRKGIHLTGDIAAYFNTAFILRKAAADLPAH